MALTAMRIWLLRASHFPALCQKAPPRWVDQSFAEDRRSPANNGRTVLSQPHRPAWRLGTQSRTALLSAARLRPLRRGFVRLRALRLLRSGGAVLSDPRVPPLLLLLARRLGLVDAFDFAGAARIAHALSPLCNVWVNLRSSPGFRFPQPFHLVHP